MLQVQLSNGQIVAIALTAAAIIGLYVLGRSGPTQQIRTLANFGCAGALVGGLGYWAGRIAPTIEGGVAFLKVCLALAAMSAVYFEARRAQEKRPVAERWKKFIGVTLGIAGIVLYFNGFKVGYQKFWHRHDQYHYYFGAKYFRELGYDSLYKCTVVALDELGTVEAEVPQKDAKTGEIVTRKLPFNLSAEVDPEDAPPGNTKVAEDARNKKIRNLGGDNLLFPAYEALEHREECTPRAKDANGNVVSPFTFERWEQFKKDIKFFRLSTLEDKPYWDGMQRDHGYNPPPVWTLTGYLITSLHDASLGFMQFLGLIDELFIVGMFVGVYWAFGWRVFSVSAILWGCQATAPAFWTMGAFLRQDWLFWFVMSACFARKRMFYASGASMVYSALLRVFPGLVVIGWLVVAGAYIVRKKRMRMDHVKTLIGGTAAAIVLVGASVLVVGKNSYQDFYKHTIKVHDQTPLTNHVGLRVMVGHRTECIFPDGFPQPVGQKDTPPPPDRKGQWSFTQKLHLPGCASAASGRMQYTQDTTGTMDDPFEIWKDMRNKRYDRFKLVAYAIIGLSFLFFAAVVARIRSLWVAQALGQIWIVLLSQLTSYYYAFIIITGPLTRLRRDLEPKLFGFAAISQVVYIAFFFNDDKYTLLTYLTLGFCYFLIGSFMPKKWAFWKNWRKEPTAAATATTKSRDEESP